MLDFIRLADDFRIPHCEEGHHHCHAGWVQTHCPECSNGQEGFHLGFSLSQGNFNCWRCGGLRFWDVITKILKKPIAECRRIVRQYEARGVRPAATPYVPAREIVPPPGLGPLQRQHRDYLRARGFNPRRLVGLWGIGGTGPASGAWAWRVVIPIYDAACEVVAYQGRAIVDGLKKKYCMTQVTKCGQRPSEMIYGIHKMRNADAVVIVEGVPGVWRIGPGAVASFGMDWKMPQMYQLRRFRRRYVMYDNEPLAQQRALALAKLLSVFPGETEVISDYDAPDPGDLTEAAAKRIRKALALSS